MFIYKKLHHISLQSPQTCRNHSFVIYYCVTGASIFSIILGIVVTFLSRDCKHFVKNKPLPNVHVHSFQIIQNVVRNYFGFKFVRGMKSLCSFFNLSIKYSTYTLYKYNHIEMVYTTGECFWVFSELTAYNKFMYSSIIKTQCNYQFSFVNSYKVFVMCKIIPCPH